MTTARSTRLLPLVSIVAVFLIWELTARYAVDMRQLPPFTEVIAAFPRHRSALLSHAADTFGSALSGFAVAGFLAFSLGVVTSHWPAWGRVVYPLVVFSQVTPKIAVAPLVVAIAGSLDVAKPLLAGLICFFPLLSAFDTGLRHVPPNLIDLFRSLHARTLQTFLKLRLPYSLPFVLAAMKVSYVFSIIGAITIEFISPSSGIGSLLLSATNNFQFDLVYLAILASSVMGLTGWGILSGLEALALRRYSDWEGNDPVADMSLRVIH